MAHAADPQQPQKTETRQVRDQDKVRPGQSKRPEATPAPAQKPVFSDWAMI